MIIDLIVYVFNQRGHRWKTKHGLIRPDEQDVKIVLDEAAKHLYSGVVGDRFEAAGLIVEKRPEGHDVYVYVGNYQ